MACFVLGHKTGKSSAALGQWLWVEADSAALIHPFQLKDVSITEQRSLVILLSVHQNCGSQNKQAVTCAILFTFSCQFVKEKKKGHCNASLLFQECIY